MKHIVVIGKYYPPEFGGIEHYAQDVARIAAKTSRVTVLVHNNGSADSFEQSGNISVIRCGTKKIVSAQPISPSMLGHMRALRPDLVQFNAPNFWAAGMLSLAGYAAPLVITHHADVFGRPFLRRAVMPIYRHIARRATCIIVSSLKNAKASRDLPKPSSRFVEIPWGIDENSYRISEEERATLSTQRRQQFGEAPIVGFVGRFVRYKALPVFVEALSRVGNWSPCPFDWRRASATSDRSAGSRSGHCRPRALSGQSRRAQQDSHDVHDGYAGAAVKRYDGDVRSCPSRGTIIGTSRRCLSAANRRGGRHIGRGYRPSSVAQ